MLREIKGERYQRERRELFIEGFVKGFCQGAEYWRERGAVVPERFAVVPSRGSVMLLGFDAWQEKQKERLPQKSVKAVS